MAQILGFDFGGTKVDIGIAEANGLLTQTHRLRVAGYRDVTALIEASLRVGQELARDRAVQVIGVSTMGITHPDRVDLAPNIPGWQEIKLPGQFHLAFPNIPVVIENDVRAACFAEFTWGSLQGSRCAGYLNLGTGMAMSFIINGQIYAGAHGAAGEIAYLWRRQEEGFRHGKAPFEESYGGGGLDRTVQREFSPYQNLGTLFDHLEDERVNAYLLETFQEIARRVGHVLLAYDVERVAVGGGIAQRFEWFAPIFSSEWADHLPFPPELVPARYSDQAGLYGAIAVASHQGGLP